MKRPVIAALCALLLCFCLRGVAEAAFIPDPARQSIGLEGVANARELGGYPARDGRVVRRGALLRTAALADATEADLRRLREVYRLSVVADFRTEGQIARMPDPEIEGVCNLHFPVYDEAVLAERSRAAQAVIQALDDPSDAIGQIGAVIDAGVSTDDMYAELLEYEAGRRGYRGLFDALLALPEGEALLMHCSQGKDRTGVAAMLVLAALDVDESVILEDYLLTNAYAADLIEEERALLAARGIAGDLRDQYLASMDAARSQRMTRAFDWMKAHYGSALGYITGALGVTEAQIQALRDKLLVPVG